MTSTTVNIESRWTDSYGEYGTSKCNGHILEESEKISLIVFCENIASNGDKFWTQLLRDKDMQAGIGRLKYLNATGKYKNLWARMSHAVNYLNKKINFLNNMRFRE